MKTKCFVVFFMVLFMWAGPALAAVAQFEMDALPMETTFEAGKPVAIDVGVTNLWDGSGSGSPLACYQSRSYPFNYTVSYAVKIEYSLWDSDLRRYVIPATTGDVDAGYAYPKSRVSLKCLDLDVLAKGLPRGNYILTAVIRLQSNGLSIPSDLTPLGNMIYQKRIKVI